MSLFKPTTRVFYVLPRLCRQASRTQHRFQPVPALTTPLRLLTTKRNNSTALNDDPRDPIDPISFHRIEEERRAYYKRRSYYSAVGVVFGMVAIWFIATSIELPPDGHSKLEVPTSRKDDPLVVIGRERKIVVQKLGEEPEEVEDVVATGTSTVPTFPRILEFSDTIDSAGAGSGTTKDGLAEYQLVGLGIRTVSFLSIQVYVVGMYIATDDIATLQAALIRKIDPIATTLVAGEKTKLKDRLLDAEKGEEIWNDVLRDTGVRTLLRIVPTRDTDFGHLRDGWVRAITAKAKKNNEEFGDETFGTSVNNFKALFRKGRVPKKKEMLLARNHKGAMAVWFDDGNGAQRLGEVQDERLSRSIWLNYLGGKTVASEPARKSIINGVMEFVQRPVGTVAAQVHV